MESGDMHPGPKINLPSVKGERPRRSVSPGRHSWRGAATRGQELVEFAIVVPLFLLFIFGVVDLARTFQALIGIANAARVGVRYGVSYGDDPLTKGVIDMSLSNIRTAACTETSNFGLNTAITSVQVCCSAVCKSEACSSSSTPTKVTCASRKIPLKVTVNYQFQPIMTGFLPSASLPLHNDLEMLIP